MFWCECEMGKKPRARPRAVDKALPDQEADRLFDVWGGMSGDNHLGEPLASRLDRRWAEISEATKTGSGGESAWDSDPLVKRSSKDRQ